MSKVFYHAGRFPLEQLEWPKLIPLLGPTAAALARYGALLDVIPNSQLLLAPLVTREAVLSSRIEGTQATMGEVLRFQAGQAPASSRRCQDIKEVLNYCAALAQAEKCSMIRQLWIRTSGLGATSQLGAPFLGINSPLEDIQKSHLFPIREEWLSHADASTPDFLLLRKPSTRGG